MIMSLISFKIGILISDSAEHSRMKCSIFSSPFPHKRQVGSILFWLNDDRFTWRMYRSIKKLFHYAIFQKFFHIFIIHYGL